MHVYPGIVDINEMSQKLNVTKLVFYHMGVGHITFYMYIVTYLSGEAINCNIKIFLRTPKSKHCHKTVKLYDMHQNIPKGSNLCYPLGLRSR